MTASYKTYPILCQWNVICLFHNLPPKKSLHQLLSTPINLGLWPPPLFFPPIGQSPIIPTPLFQIQFFFLLSFISTPEMESETPANFWGQMPEEEFYMSQGIRNRKSYFETPNGKLFTQSFVPLNQKVKATVYMTHGYGSDTGWLFQKICINFATWGYSVFAADLFGHGRSDGLRCYLGTDTKPYSIKNNLCSKWDGWSILKVLIDRIFFLMTIELKNHGKRMKEKISQILLEKLKKLDFLLTN